MVFLSSTELPCRQWKFVIASMFVVTDGVSGVLGNSALAQIERKTLKERKMERSAAVRAINKKNE